MKLSAFSRAAAVLLASGSVWMHGCAGQSVQSAESASLSASSPAAAAAPGHAAPPVAPGVLVEVAPGVHQARLANGMTLIVKPDNRSPVAVHMVWVRVGSMDEVDGTSGVAHMLEHMMFKGTKTLGPGEFSRRVAEMGGRDNAFTSTDYTAYFQLLPAARLADAMALEADRFANNQWSDEEFTREMAVVKEERRLRTEDVPRSRLHEQQMAAAFMASPYHRPVIGWMGDLDSMTADDVRAFYRQWYVPGNAAVVVAGAVEPAAVLALAEKTYGRISAGELPARKPRPEPPQQGERRLQLHAAAEQAVVSLMFKAPRMGDMQPSPESDDALALTVLSAVLDGYSGARLERALVQGKSRLADGVEASNGLMGRGPQLFNLIAIPAKGVSAERVEKALLEQVALIARDGISEAELERVKTQWIASEVYKRDSVMGQAMELGSYWALGLPADTDARLIERLRHITAAQVQAVARKYFDTRQMTAATLIPDGKPAAPRRPVPGMRH